MAFDRIAVVGAGAWGCALANVIARAGRPVRREPRFTPPPAAPPPPEPVPPELAEPVEAPTPEPEG